MNYYTPVPRVVFKRKSADHFWTTINPFAINVLPSESARSIINSKNIYCSFDRKIANKLIYTILLI